MAETQLHSPQRSAIRTSDREEVQGFLSAAYDTAVQVEFGDHAPPDGLSYSHSRTAVGLFATEIIDQQGVVRASAAHLEPAVVYLPQRGRVECHLHSCNAGAGPGDVLLAQCTDGLLRTHQIDSTSRAVVLHQTLLIEAAAAESLSFIRFTGHRPISAAAAQAFRYATEFVCDTVLSDDDKATPLVLAAAGRLLASAALAAFPSTVVQVNGNDDLSRHASPLTLRRAIDFIDENAHNDIGVSDIAATVYLTPRTVQYMFRRYLDLTPTEYLRKVRLERAQRDLIEMDRASTTVAATAARWGFAHTGRFAVQYRQMFGESPHETLRH